jgi:hypothetical protein
MERLVRVKGVSAIQNSSLPVPSEDSAEPKHTTQAEDSAKTRRIPCTQAKHKTRQRLNRESCRWVFIVLDFHIFANVLAHPRREGSLKIKLDACRRRMERLVRVKGVSATKKCLAAGASRRLGRNQARNLRRGLHKDSAEPLHTTQAKDSAKTRRKTSTQAEHKTRLRLSEKSWHSGCIALGFHILANV